MSAESQAIFSGHICVEKVVKLVRAEIAGKVMVRDMHRPEYKIVEFQRLDGDWSVLHLFLESYAAADYADAYEGPSTFMTAEYTPQNFNLVRMITAALGGLARRTPAEPWLELEPAQL